MCIKQVWYAAILGGFLLHGWMAFGTAGAKQPASLWDEFWSYDVRQYPTTGLKSYREDLTFLAATTGPAPASDTTVIRKNYAGGKVRALFILPYADTRYPLELAARFDLEYDVLPVSLFSKTARAGDGFKTMKEDLDGRLLDAIENGKFDVIVALGFDGSVLSAKQQARICEWIRGGMGWVDLGLGREKPAMDSAIRALLPMAESKTSRASAGAPETGPAPFIRAGLPPTADRNAKVAERFSGQAALRVKEGMAVAVRDEGMERLVAYSAGWPRNEAGYSLLMKCILWASRKDWPILVEMPPHGSFRRSDCAEMAVPGDFARTARPEPGIPLCVFFTVEGTNSSVAAGEAAPAQKLKLNWELRDGTGAKYDEGKIAFNVSLKQPATLFIRPSVRPLAGVSELFYDIEDEDGRRVTWGQDMVTVESDLRLAGVDLPDFFERTAKECMGTLRFESLKAAEVEVVFSLRLLDSHGRKLPFALTGEARVKPETNTSVVIRIPCDFEYLFGPMGFLAVDVSESGEDSAPFARQKIPFFAPRPPSAALDDWQCGVCGIGPGLNAPNAHPWDGFYPAISRTLHERGINAANNGVWIYPNDLLPIAREGFNIYTEYICTMFGHFSAVYENHVYSPNYLPPWAEKGRKEMVRQVERVKLLRKLGVAHYACSEEVGLGPSEVCFSDTTRAAFRKWALEKYGRLERLNTAWGTDFKSAEDVRGILLDDALARQPANPAQWIDFRMFMEELFNGALEDYCRIGKSFAPEGFFGYTAGPYSEVPNPGHNRARLGKTIDSCVEYLGPWLNMGSAFNYFDVLRSRHVPLLLSVSGYSSCYMPSFMLYQNCAWYTALHGGKGIIYYATIHPSKYAKLAGTGAPIGATDRINEANNDLLNGLGRLIIRSKRSSAGVGLYYSRPSQYALAWRNALFSRTDMKTHKEDEQKEAAALRDNPDGAKEEKKPAKKQFTETEKFRNFSAHSFAALRELALAAGYNYDIVFNDQLLSGQLAKDFKILLLPSVVSLSEAELNSLQAFVQNGGLLVADMETGIYDELGRPNPKISEVDELFGVARDLSVFAMDPLKGVLAEPDGGEIEGYGVGGATVLRRPGSARALRPGESASPRREAQGGRAMASIAGRDAVIVREAGKGKTMYLNLVPKRHGDLLNASRDPLFVSPALRRKFIRLAESVGAPRPIVLADEKGDIPGLDNVEIVRFDHGRNRYVFFHHKFASNDVITVKARLEKPFHVYDMRKREYLGLTDSPTLAVPHPSQAAAYAFLDHKVTAVSVIVPGKVRAGEQIPVRVLLASEGEKPENHVVHLEVCEPDGRLNWRFTRNLDLAGPETKIALRPTLDEKAGRWKIIARDVQSGVMGETAFEMQALKKPKGWKNILKAIIRK